MGEEVEAAAGNDLLRRQAASSATPAKYIISTGRARLTVEVTGMRRLYPA
jgi:hypothetical protein